MALEWANDIARRWYQLKLADTALQVEKDTRRQAVTEHAIRKAYELVGAGPVAQWPLEGDDMAVNVGDNVTITPSSGLAAISAAALAIGGLGAGVPAGLLVAKMLADPPPVVQQLEPAPVASPPATPPPLPGPATDHDTQYDFGIGVTPGGALK